MRDTEPNLTFLFSGFSRFKLKFMMLCNDISLSPSVVNGVICFSGFPLPSGVFPILLVVAGFIGEQLACSFSLSFSLSSSTVRLGVPHLSLARALVMGVLVSISPAAPRD